MQIAFQMMARSASAILSGIADNAHRSKITAAAPAAAESRR